MDAAERGPRFDHTVWMISRIGDPDRFLTERYRIRESSKVREAEREPRARPRREVSGNARVRWFGPSAEGAHGLPQQIDRVHKIADGEVGLGQPVSRLELEIAVAEVGGDCAGLSPSGERRAMITDVSQSRARVGDHVPEPAVVVEVAGEALGFA
jgi:hypothetical protein